jgi:hypothetical protein
VDKWIQILLEVEEMWAASVDSRLIQGDTEIYCRERDIYKARRILDLYGEEYFFKFVERCPHIKDYIQDYIPRSCEDPKRSRQCNLFCYFYKDGGCEYATE